jgi:hypothetical protein
LVSRRRWLNAYAAGKTSKVSAVEETVKARRLADDKRGMGDAATHAPS